jgi:hypothetical protein
VAQRFLTDNANRPSRSTRSAARAATSFDGGRPFARNTSASSSHLKYSKAQEIAQSAIQAFLDHEVDEVVLLYNEFKSVIQQRVVTQRLLPLDAVHGEEKANAGIRLRASPPAIFDKLLPKVVEITVWQALLESNAAEHGARMAAMDSATRNAADHRQPDPLHEQGATGRDHQRNHRSRLGLGRVRRHPKADRPPSPENRVRKNNGKNPWPQRTSVESFR